MRNSTSVLTELVHKLQHLLKYSYSAYDGHVLKYPLRSVTVKSKLEFSLNTFYVTCGWRKPVRIYAVALLNDVNFGVEEYIYIILMLEIYLLGIWLGADTVFTKRRRVSIGNISLMQGLPVEKLLASVRELWDVRIWRDNF